MAESARKERKRKKKERGEKPRTNNKKLHRLVWGGGGSLYNPKTPALAPEENPLSASWRPKRIRSLPGYTNRKIALQVLRKNNKG